MVFKFKLFILYLSTKSGILKLFGQDPVPKIRYLRKLFYLEFPRNKQNNNRNHRMGVLTPHVYWRVGGNSVALAVHGCNSLAMFLALQGDFTRDPDITTLKSNQYKFITIWNMIFQMIFLSMSLACDIPILLNIKKEDKLIGILRKYKNIFFSGVVWPTSALIFVIFWPIYLYDRDLIFPTFIDKALSQWSNHVMHSSIIPIVVWTVVFQPRSKPTSQLWDYIHLGTIFVCYFIFLLYNHAVTSSWPYPLLDVLYGTIYFPMLFIVIVCLYIFLYYIQWPLTSYIHDTPKLKKK